MVWSSSHLSQLHLQCRRSPLHYRSFPPPLAVAVVVVVVVPNPSRKLHHLLLSPIPTPLIPSHLQVPSVNAIFFNGDRVDRTGNPVIERLSDPQHIAQVLVSKLGTTANAWVIGASSFAGPFAVYKDLVPSVDRFGDPKCYDPSGFPALTSTAAILAKVAHEVGTFLIFISNQLLY